MGGQLRGTRRNWEKERQRTKGGRGFTWGRRNEKAGFRNKIRYRSPELWGILDEKEAWGQSLEWLQSTTMIRQNGREGRLYGQEGEGGS